MLKFCAISDTHNQHLDIENIPECDMIIHSGDCTGRGTEREIRTFLDWYSSLNHQYKILIAGNHDWGFQKDYKKYKKMCDGLGIIYLQDTSVEIEGIKIHGSPQTPEFFNWAFNCWRTLEEEKTNDDYHGGYRWIGHYWKMIPDDTDILITHGPPKGIRDYCPPRYNDRYVQGHVGCQELLNKVMDIKPKYHIFGHIHHAVGDEIIEDVHFINASSLNGSYNPNNVEIKEFEI